MSEGIVIEDPKWAHIGRPPAEPIWWRFWLNDASSDGLTIVALKTRTWFEARAAARVLLASESIDGETLDPSAVESMLADDRTEFFIGPHDVLFCDRADFLTHGSPRNPFCTRRADRDGVEIRDLAEDEDENASDEDELAMRDGAEQATPTNEGEGQ